MINVEIGGVSLKLETSPDLFSPSAVDAGTLEMLSETVIMPDDRVLDLGCGYGVVGIYAAKKVGVENVTMCDVLELAAELAAKNAVLNGVGGVKIYCCDGLRGFDERGFTLILSNPPYHTDFSVAKHFIEEGYRRLAAGGRMVMVTKRLGWYKNKLTSVFGGCRVAEKGGYYVFIAEKRPRKPAVKQTDGLSKKLRRKLKK